MKREVFKERNHSLLLLGLIFILGFFVVLVAAENDASQNDRAYYKQTAERLNEYLKNKNFDNFLRVLLITES